MRCFGVSIPEDEVWPDELMASGLPLGPALVVRSTNDGVIVTPDFLVGHIGLLQKPNTQSNDIPHNQILMACFGVAYYTHTKDLLSFLVPTHRKYLALLLRRAARQYSALAGRLASLSPTITTPERWREGRYLDALKDIPEGVSPEEILKRWRRIDLSLPATIPTSSGVFQ